MRPSFHIKEENSSVKIAPAKVRSGMDEVVCPTGTVPIRRTTKDELIRAKSLWNNNILSKVSLFNHVNFLINNLISNVHNHDTYHL